MFAICVGRKALEETTEMRTKVVVHKTEWRLSRTILVDQSVHWFEGKNLKTVIQSY